MHLPGPDFAVQTDPLQHKSPWSWSHVLSLQYISFPMEKLAKDHLIGPDGYLRVQQTRLLEQLLELVLDGFRALGRPRPGC